MVGKCKNVINMEVTEHGSDQMVRVFWVYRFTDYGERQEVWKLIWDRSINIRMPWMCVGDFNDILYNHEKEEGMIRSERKIRGFRDMIEGGNLINLKSQGQRFT